MAQAQGMHLTRGQRVRARVEEVLSESSLIVSFTGRLVRVVNSTQKNIQVGDWLDLQVVAAEPLEFRFFKSSSHQFVRVV